MVLAEVYDLSINYVLEVGTGEVQALIDTFTELFPQHKKTTMTAARQLEKKGEKKGEIEGRQTRSIEITQGMLVKNYPIEDIIQLTQLSKEEINRLKK